MTELLPAIERKYRGIGEGWARGLMGGSTGGWESFAVQVLYPDEFNYAVAACPDPIGFTSYTTVNLYEDSNAYYYDAPFKRTARPGQRDHYSGTTVKPGTSRPDYGRPYGHTTATVEEMNRRELVLGPHSRSCGQWDSEPPPNRTATLSALPSFIHSLTRLATRITPLQSGRRSSPHVELTGTLRASGARIHVMTAALTARSIRR